MSNFVHLIFFFFLSVLQSIWSLQIQCFHLYGGSLDSIGYLLVAKLWRAMHLSFTGLSKVIYFLLFSWIFCLCLIVVICCCMDFVLQGLYSFSGIWRVICRILHCPGMYCWYCCLLLSAMYYCNFIRCRRPGMSPCWLVWAPLVSYHYILSSSHAVAIDELWDVIS